MSENSVEAYINDVSKLHQFLVFKGSEKGPDKVQLSDLQELLVWAIDLGMQPTSQARLISGLRAFYKYLALEEDLKSNPTELLETPKMGRKLPVFLTVDEVDALIAAIDRSTNEGQRNVAMLETLYSCGLRVSELVNLKFEDLFLTRDSFASLEKETNNDWSLSVIRLKRKLVFCIVRKSFL